MKTQRHILLGHRWNGRIAKLYDSACLSLTNEMRRQRLATGKWKYAILVQGYFYGGKDDFKDKLSYGD